MPTRRRARHMDTVQVLDTSKWLCWERWALPENKRPLVARAEALKEADLAIEKATAELFTHEY
jgi:hypothetical protein